MDVVPYHESVEAVVVAPGTRAGEEGDEGVTNDESGSDDEGDDDDEGDEDDEDGEGSSDDEDSDQGRSDGDHGRDSRDSSRLSSERSKRSKHQFELHDILLPRGRTRLLHLYPRQYTEQISQSVKNAATASSQFGWHLPRSTL